MRRGSEAKGTEIGIHRREENVTKKDWKGGEGREKTVTNTKHSQKQNIRKESEGKRNKGERERT